MAKLMKNSEKYTALPAEIKTNVVVVGGGGSGLASAIAAQQAGAKVIVLEKLGILGTHIAIRRASTTRYQMILRSVDGYPVKPGVESTVSPEVSQRPVGLDESLLSHVLSFLLVMHETHHQPQNPVLVLEYQQIKGTLVATLHALDQLLILFFYQHVRPLLQRRHGRLSTGLPR